MFQPFTIYLRFCMTFTASFAWFWLMIKQVQIFFILLITISYIPDEVKIIIEGVKFALFPINYFEFKKFYIFNSLIDRFHFELQDTKFEPLGFDSESAIYNTCSFFVLIFNVIILHILLVIIQKILQRWLLSPGICSWFLKFLFWVLKKLLDILTFSYYIRTTLEMSQFILSACIYEISKFNHSSRIKLASLIISGIILITWLVLIIFIFMLAIRHIEATNKVLSEFFRGIKPSKKHRLWVSISLIRLLLAISIIVAVHSYSVIIAVGVQIIYTFIVIFIRPFTHVQPNIIGCMNEIYFTVLLSMLTYFNSEARWTSTVKDVYIWIIISNSILSFLITSGNTAF